MNEQLEIIKENIEKAEHDAGFLQADLRMTYSIACEKNPVLAILLYDLMTEAAKINNRIKEIQGAL